MYAECITKNSSYMTDFIQKRKEGGKQKYTHTQQLSEYRQYLIKENKNCQPELIDYN